MVKQKEVSQSSFQKILKLFSYFEDCLEYTIPLLNTYTDYSKRYESAKKKYDNKQYDEARDIFFSLNDYKDSNLFIGQCERLIKERHRQYRAALNKFDEKEYGKAKSIFVSLGDYENSKQYAEQCEPFILLQQQYSTAINKYNVKKYDEAINMFLMQNLNFQL